ncbi:Hydrocephalus-inducing protein [Fasciola gigantica]|uniref:Hydrocephalus-inducing protein n=1 Tax=Fasciola gigantica TaxID=46835 RepID=A0A504Y8U1_FASGI|nr:Hydrocephalus-inducing protein [Fasciola gigantica]
MELLKKYSEADTTRSSSKQLPIMKDFYALTPSEYAAYANFSSKQYWKNLRFVFPPEITSINVLDIVSPDKPYPTDLHLVKHVPFSVKPIEGVVRPYSEKEIVITFSPEKAQEYQDTLYCDVEGLCERLRLDVNGLGVGPRVKYSFCCLDIGRVFIGSKHSYELVLSNVGCIDAIFTAQKPKTLFSSCFTLTPEEGLINPGGYQAIQIDFYSPSQLGQFEECFEFLSDGCIKSDRITIRGEVVGPTFHFDVNEVDFGQISYGKRTDLSASYIIPITCVGEGPVIYIEPTKLDWGTIPVLQSNRKTITLTNESVIPAVFTLKTDNVDSIYKTEPTCGIIPPLSHREVFVIAKPDDTITFRENLLLMVEDTKTTRHISLSSTGSGGTITTEPAMPSTLHLGPYFGSLPARNVFRITNRGRRQQQLIWSIEGHSVRRQSVSDAKGAKTLIKTVNCAVEFIAPLVYLSSHELIYRVEKSPTDHLEKQTRELCLRNDSGLPLTCLLELVYPFSLLENGQAVSKQKLHLEAGRSVPIHVQFDPAYQNDQYSRRADELLFVRYEQHPQTDAVRLVGEVHFPNLEFDTNRISFGYILNHTEVTRKVTMKNVSPLPVRFRWSFLVGQRTNIVFKRQARLKSSKSGSQCIETTELDHSEVDKDVVKQSVEEPRDENEPL